MGAINGYTITTDFSQEETNQVAGRSTARTAAIDAEFSNLKTSIDSIIARCEAISRDDDELQDGLVTIASLAADVLALIGDSGFNPLGQWVTSTVYAQSDLVTNGTGTYVCAVAHTSGVFATDLAAGKWITLFDSSVIAASAVTFTPTGDLVAANAQAAIAELDTEKMAKAANGSDIANAATFRGNISVQSRGEAQLQTLVYAEDVGTSDAMVATLSSSPPAAYASGLFATIKKAASENSSTAPTLNWCGLGARTIFARGGAALSAGDMPANAHLDFQYDEALDGGAGGWELKTPHASSATSGAVSFSGVITPTAISASQNNYSPTGLSVASGMRLSSSAAYDITGLAGGGAGRLMTVHNVGANDLTLLNESASSSASNRFDLLADFVLAAGTSVILQYDATSARWRLFNEPNATSSATISQYNFDTLI